MTYLTSEELARVCAEDGEFRLASRYWNGGLRFEFGREMACSICVADGEPRAGDPGDGSSVITLAASDEVWASLLAPVPPRYLNDIATAVDLGLRRSGDDLLFAQYYPAIMRAVELMRGPRGDVPTTARETRPLPRFDAPQGRYVHLELDGLDHRIYFEEAGVGIPMLLQHTAGSHGSQWRHLFECDEVTEHFRLIAYDLPYHGKSIPPVGKRWWAEEYKLRGEFLRSVPVTLAAALELKDPVFMGCSVGGLLALDLASHHADLFRAVISLEGALKVESDGVVPSEFWHPQVSNEYKARLMDSLMSPSSPEFYRKETTQTYAAGWPPALQGDLNYYLHEFDLTKSASKIDTRQVGVHILTGEYDWSAPIRAGRAAHEAIAGSTFSAMPGVGHFPMSENPEAFIGYLLPVLEKIRSA